MKSLLIFVYPLALVLIYEGMRQHFMLGQAIGLSLFICILVFHALLVRRETIEAIETGDKLNQYLKHYEEVTRLGIECEHCHNVIDTRFLVDGEWCPDCGHNALDKHNMRRVF